MSLAPAPGAITATVAAREFLGGIVRYRVRAGAHTIVVDVPHRRRHAVLAVGAEIGVVLDPGRVTVLR